MVNTGSICLINVGYTNWETNLYLFIISVVSKIQHSVLFLTFYNFFFRASITSSSDTQHNPYNSHFNPRVREKLKLYKDRDDKEIAMRKFANQTAQNVTFLLDHLLHQYDNSLRPDIRGILLRPQFSTKSHLRIALLIY